MQAEEFKSLLSSSGIPVHTDLENDFIGIVQLFNFIKFICSLVLRSHHASMARDETIQIQP